MKSVECFKNKFKDVIEKLLPSFWNQDGDLISLEGYTLLLAWKKSDDSKLDDMEQKLKGKIIMETLWEYFNTLANLSRILWFSLLFLIIGILNWTYKQGIWWVFLYPIGMQWKNVSKYRLKSQEIVVQPKSQQQHYTSISFQILTLIRWI